MRAREFLLEYRHDITMQNFGEKFRDRMLGDITITSTTQYNLQAAKEKGIGPASDEITPGYLRRIEQSDPTANKEYTQWMVRAYINGLVRYFEDVESNLAEFVAMHSKLKTHRRLPAQLRDINQIKDTKAFRAAYIELADIYDEFREQVVLTDKGKSTEIYNGAEVRIIQPHNEAASCYYGQGTQWCTATTISRNYFNDFNADGPLLILIPKQQKYNGEKYQIHLEERQVMNEQDDPVSLKLLVDRFPNTDLKSILTKINPEWNDVTELMDKDNIDQLIRLYNSRLIHFNKWFINAYLTSDQLTPKQKETVKRIADAVNWPTIGTFTVDRFYESLIDDSRTKNNRKGIPIHTKEYLSSYLAKLSSQLMDKRAADSKVGFEFNIELGELSKLPNIFEKNFTRANVGLRLRSMLQIWEILIRDWRIVWDKDDPEFPTYIGPTRNSLYQDTVGYSAR